MLARLAAKQLLAAVITTQLSSMALANEEKSPQADDNIQRQYYQELVKSGVAPAIAAMMTIRTEVLAADEQKLHLVQTLVDGSQRDLILRVKAAKPSGPQIPLMLDDGQVIAADRVSVSHLAGGYRLETDFIVPGDGVPIDISQTARLDPDKSTILSRLLGIAEAHAQAFGTVEIAIGAVDSFTAPVQSSGSSSAGFIDSAVELVTSTGSDLLEGAIDVPEALKDPAVSEAAKSRLGEVAEVAKSVAGVVKNAAGTYKSYQEYKAMEAKLAAAEDCADNPTEPTAIDAKKNDPNYRRATTERIRSARNDLKFHFGIKMFTSAANSAASTVLGANGASPASKAWGKSVGFLDKAEEGMLNHVAEEYIMKDATKGVVPCKDRCEPNYSPAPPPEALASYPPTSMSCETPAPEQLVCVAISSSSSQNFSSYSPPPAPRTPPPWALTCGTLSTAEFTYGYRHVTSNCSQFGCESTEDSVRFNGTVALKPAGDKGYDGHGKGTWGQLETRDVSTTMALPCQHSSWVRNTNGSIDLVVTARFSIATGDLGGLDTGEMNSDTSVVEILLEGEAPYDETQKECDKSSNDSGMLSIGPDCHFYGVDLYRPGFYKVYKDGDPASGVCTLNLSR